MPVAQIDAKGITVSDNSAQFTPVTLQGSVVRLEPMLSSHADLFWEAAGDAAEEIFRWFPYRLQSRADFEVYVNRILADQGRGVSLPFATVDQKSGAIIGGTCFLARDANNRRVEIGSTWLVPAWQRTAANTEAKLLMLGYAFETWKCIRVELKTDARNQRSQKAMLRLGAKEEGTLRQHVICWDGHLRDTVYFSVLDSEWPTVKDNLISRLAS
jgi:RimJ/RimL family protein N-acetyltransferase